MRNFFVKLPANGDGTYTVTAKYTDGRFVTTPGQSPGACETSGHGSTLTDGIDGSFKGGFTMVVTDGTFNQNGVCVLDASDTNEIPQCLRSGFVAGFFGPEATFAITKFNFVYKGSSSLLFFQWTNADTGNIGDIATS